MTSSWFFMISTPLLIRLWIKIPWPPDDLQARICLLFLLKLSTYATSYFIAGSLLFSYRFKRDVRRFLLLKAIYIKLWEKRMTHGLCSCVPQIGIIKHLDPLIRLCQWSFHTRLYLYTTIYWIQHNRNNVKSTLVSCLQLAKPWLLILNVHLSKKCLLKAKAPTCNLPTYERWSVSFLAILPWCDDDEEVDCASTLIICMYVYTQFYRADCITVSGFLILRRPSKQCGFGNYLLD